MRWSELRRSVAVVVSVTVGGFAAAACVGNEPNADSGDASGDDASSGDGTFASDGSFATDASGADDATGGDDASGDAGIGDAAVDAPDGADAACSGKTCDGGCVSLDDPTFGCSATTCAQAPTACGTRASCVDCTTAIKNATNARCDGTDHCAYTACNFGWLDADGDPTNGCESASPAGVPERGYLMGWWIADTGLTGSSVKNWADQAGLHTAICTSCPTFTPNALHGHATFTFDGSTTFFQLFNGPYVFDAYGLTWFIVWNPASSGSYAPLLSFNTTTSQDTSRLEIGNGGSGDSSNFYYAVCNSGSCPGWGASIWATGWHATVVNHKGTGIAGEAPVVLSDNTTNVGGFGFNGASTTVTLPAGQSRPDNYIGLDTYNRYFNGQIAEIIVYTAALTPASQTAIETYLKNKYGY